MSLTSELPADVPSAWREELEALESILDDGSLQLAGRDGLAVRRRLLAESKPALSCATLLLRCPAEAYPAAPLAVQLLDVRGLSVADEAALLHTLRSRAQELAGDSMPAAFDLYQETLDFLTAHNNPSEDCVICCEPVTPQTLLRTSCFHYFHGGCLARYVQHRRNNPHLEVSADVYQGLRALHRTEEAVQAALLAQAREAPVPCPTCREALDKAALDAVQRIGKAAKAAAADGGVELSISAEQRKLQEQRRRLFQRQLERGGIIDAYSKPADHDVVHIADDNDDAAAAAAVNSGGVPLAPTMAEVLTPVPINTSGSGQAGGKRDRPKKQLAFPADTPAVDASADTGRGHGSSGRGGRGRSRKSSSSSRSGSRASAVVEA